MLAKVLIPKKITGVTVTVSQGKIRTHYKDVTNYTNWCAKLYFHVMNNTTISRDI